VRVQRYAEADIPTAHGTVRLIVFRTDAAAPGGAPDEHSAILFGPEALLGGPEPVLARVHSECWTGEVLGSKRCDCRAQLDQAMSALSAEGRGVIVYLRQEGRGIGLGNKIRAYALQDRGADTVDANLVLGFADDARTYDIAAAILQALGVSRVRLMTNNPKKVLGLRAHGVEVTARVPATTPPTESNAGYLDVKARRLGHAT
jgi:3,4-dihydroxy 2-butanone 4-phosphate synthase/GTP cyclohydrolase II